MINFQVCATSSRYGRAGFLFLVQLPAGGSCFYCRAQGLARDPGPAWHVQWHGSRAQLDPKGLESKATRKVRCVLEKGLKNGKRSKSGMISVGVGRIGDLRLWLRWYWFTAPSPKALA